WYWSRRCHWSRRGRRTRRRAGWPARIQSRAGHPARTRDWRSVVLPIEMTQGLADVDLPWPGDLLLLVRRAFLPAGEPAGHPADREQHREHGHREAHGLVDDARVEVDVRIELVADEIVVLERDPLEFQSDVEQRVPPGHLEHLVRHALDDLG